MKKQIGWLVLLFLILFSACGEAPKSASRAENTDWKTVLQEKLPLLGHRNWIVVTDKAYPLQTEPGILTLYADEPYETVLAEIQQQLKKATHVYPHVYQDQELALLKEDLCPGIDTFRTNVGKVLASETIIPIAHDELILRLDSISNLFQIIIVKTNLTMPYTSTFFELDCKYWNAQKQQSLLRQL